MCAWNYFGLKKNGDRPWISVYFFCNRGNTDCVYTYIYIVMLFHVCVRVGFVDRLAKI